MALKVGSSIRGSCFLGKRRHLVGDSVTNDGGLSVWLRGYRTFHTKYARQRGRVSRMKYCRYHVTKETEFGECYVFHWNLFDWFIEVDPQTCIISNTKTSCEWTMICTNRTPKASDIERWVEARYLNQNVYFWGSALEQEYSLHTLILRFLHYFSLQSCYGRP